MEAYLKKVTSTAGKARAASMTPRERQRLAASGGRAVWAGISAEERSRRMQAAIKARWSPEGRAKALAKSRTRARKLLGR